MKRRHWKDKWPALLGKNSVKMVGGKHMKVWGLGAALMLLAVLVAGCGGNSTKIGVTVVGPVASPMTIIVNTSVQFSASVTGSSTSTVYWQICKPDSTTSTTVAPTDCTAGQGPIGCNDNSRHATPLVGFGTITVEWQISSAPATPCPRQTSFLIKWLQVASIRRRLERLR